MYLRGEQLTQGHKGSSTFSKILPCVTYYQPFHGTVCFFHFAMSSQALICFIHGESQETKEVYE